MFIITNGIQQIFRTPAKTILFLFLLALSSAFLSIGANLFIVSVRNMEVFEKSFSTIGTVRQKPNILNEISVWDAGNESYSYISRPVYDTEIPISVLDFEGANYIHPPEKRPYYGAYLDNYNVSDYNGGDIGTILEVEPLEDCVPSKPVKLRIKRVLLGNFGSYTNDIWFCDHHNDNPAPMYAGKTYIISVLANQLSTHAGFEGALEREYIPTVGIESSQYDMKGALVPDTVAGDYQPYEEVTVGYYDTPRGQRWFELVEGFAKLTQAFPVVPTNATNLLMDFYNGNAYIVDGRDISPEEYIGGDRVCLIQQGFAKRNNLCVGGVLPLPMYYANYRHSASQNFFRNGIGFGFGQLNAEGKSYPVFEEGTYKIVGIYEATGGSYLASGFESGNNMVVIPSASVESSDENNILAYGPMQAYNTSFEIPNGTIDAFMRAWSKQGIDGLDIQFYDKGFSQLKDGFDRMRAVSIILMAVGAVVMLLVLTFFTYLFIFKNKKRTAIERSLGLGRGKCALSLLSGMLPLCALGITAGVGTGFLLGSSVMELITAAANEEEFDLLYSSWVNNADKVADMQVVLQQVYPNVFFGVAFIVFTLSIVFACVGVWKNMRQEPLSLLCQRDER